MTEAMIVEAVKSAGASLPQAQKLVPQPTADPAAVELFQGLMGPAQPTPIPAVTQVAETWSAAQQYHQGILHRIRALTELRRVKGPSAADMTELQYEVATLAFQQEVVTNVAKKASDAVSTLIKNG